MPTRTSTSGSELFIVDNSDEDWKVVRYLHDWCQISKAIDIATGYFEIGSLLALKDEWQKVDQIRILMGDEVSLRTKRAFDAGLASVAGKLDESLEREKDRNAFLEGVDAIVEAIRTGKIACRVYRGEKFHAKAYITHARMEVVGSSALVGSSNFTFPGLTENIELNVQITGRPVTVLQEWYEEHWNRATDVTPDVLRVIERHVAQYTPFEVYARSLLELFRGHELTAGEWERHESRVFPILAPYQREGYQGLLKRAQRYNGAFLCDGVGLGKTFVGLMLIERLIVHDRKNVALFVPKAAREAVWGRELRKRLPHLFGKYSNLAVFNHTDLLRGGSFAEDLESVRQRAHVIVVDEAHHFRNTGTRGAPDDPQSRYWKLFELAEGKTLYLLTATPVNNHLRDLQHMIELFSRQQGDYFKDAPLGIHSLPGHFRRMENELDRMLDRSGTLGAAEECGDTNLAEAEQVLSTDDLFRALVVQRSRAYVKQSSAQEGSGEVPFPKPKEPKVVPYSVKQTYGKLLTMVEEAFNKEKPLFSLAIYYPLAYYKGDDTSIDPLLEGRQRQVVSLIRTGFLKRFESSVEAFQMSCWRLLQKLLAWVEKNADAHETKVLTRFKDRHAALLKHAANHQTELFPDEEDEADEDLVPEELVLKAEKLTRSEYRVEEIIDETMQDLEQLTDFLGELERFKPSQDKKLAALVKLLKSDAILKKHKVLIFSEFMDTARYVRKELNKAGIEGVEEIDSAVKTDRVDIIRRFSPYYNGSSSGQLESEGEEEIRVLVSTDVLSEGLNLQDATRLINYDIHWNPVRLMQRVGRVDRRMDAEVEARIVQDHPDQTAIRGEVAYWNFLPPDELDRLLKLYAKVAKKTLRISKTFGIEGRKLLRPEDDYEALKDWTDQYEGTLSPLESLHLELQRLLKEDAGLEQRLSLLPGQTFSGRAHPREGARAVFFCYALPAPQKAEAEAEPTWSLEAGSTAWYLYDLETKAIEEEPARMVETIRTQPATPRRCRVERPTLAETRTAVEKHIRDSYLKKVQAPIGVRPVLRAWMELN